MTIQQFGLTSAGFIAKPQAQIIQEIVASLQSTFGANINLAPSSVLSQLIGIISEREALLWLLAEGIYASQYPGGAEGTSVDHILALNNLKRLAALPTVTNPSLSTSGYALYGLVLGGVPGTTIPARSLIQTTATPPLSFLLDNPVVISAAQNAVQTLFVGNTPTVGNFALSITDATGTLLTTETLPFNTLSNQSILKLSGIIGTGSMNLILTQGGVVSAAILIDSSTTAASLQTAVRAIPAYAGVSVARTLVAPNVLFTFSWGTIPQPLLSTSSNTTSSPVITPTVIDSIQAAINNLYDVSTLNYPYTDVTVSGSFGSSSFIITFGGGAVLVSNPSSGASQQNLIVIASNTLFAGTTYTNLNIVNTIVGSPAQGIGNATCTITGPNFVKAGTLTVIGSPISGWVSVNNELDCITGSNIESDTEALTRRSLELATEANGPLQAIVQKVLNLSGVIAAVGFQNTTSAALQNIGFDSIPSSGQWVLNINGQTTTPPFTSAATSTTLQTALQNLIGYSQVQVTGGYASGFIVNFNGSQGAQVQPLFTISGNTTGVGITVSYGRPPKSFEIVVQGGDSTQIAQAIYESMPAGIASYSASTAITTGSTTFGSTTLTVASNLGIILGNAIFGLGIAQGATVLAIAGTSITMSAPALLTVVSVPILFNNTVTILDAFNNPVQIAFSRPVSIPIYVVINLVTDTYLVPGNSSSGINPASKFNLQSITQIQNDILAIANKIPIGGRIIGLGSNGLVGAFNAVPGIVSYTLAFGTSTTPSGYANIQLQPEQLALFQTNNIGVTFT